VEAVPPWEAAAVPTESPPVIVVDLVNDAVLRQWVQQAAHAVASLGRSSSVEARAHLLARFVALTLGGGEVSRGTQVVATTAILT